MREEEREEEEVPEEVLCDEDKGIMLVFRLFMVWERIRACEVHTLLNTTNTTVCTNHANGRSAVRRPNKSPRPSARPICGAKLVSGERRTRCRRFAGCAGSAMYVR